eukprot:gnl/TRDRNA2_/TRDRNA2_196202_c0_seq1.p1 gnl/TRDRNA2_/TRDRNA2_196202_c0~~gnl/TRDRNA2_/TRDRNA2_196202_c0_seq1.p1  ORF type:complete len:100 (+),score=3.27 gnl/TRDRNA2_/TRDRNA2_196202_c0_seq1:31-330(+)
MLALSETRPFASFNAAPANRRKPERQRLPLPTLTVVLDCCRTPRSSYCYTAFCFHIISGIVHILHNATILRRHVESTAATKKFFQILSHLTTTRLTTSA